jgi:hypothetical protein
MVFSPTGQRFFTVALGSFVDAVFPPPTAEFFTKFRHPWVPPIPDAVQLYDEADAEPAWRKAGGEPANRRIAGDPRSQNSVFARVQR